MTGVQVLRSESADKCRTPGTLRWPTCVLGSAERNTARIVAHALRGKMCRSGLPIKIETPGSINYRRVMPGVVADSCLDGGRGRRAYGVT